MVSQGNVRFVILQLNKGHTVELETFVSEDNMLVRQEDICLLVPCKVRNTETQLLMSGHTDTSLEDTHPQHAYVETQEQCDSVTAKYIL